MQPEPVRGASLSSSAKLSCLVCATCDASIAQSSDILTYPIPAGRLSSSTTFAYELEDLLDLSVGAWCYSCTEHVESSLTLVEPSSLEPSPWSGTSEALRQLHQDTIIGNISNETAYQAPLMASAATTSRREANSNRVDLIRTCGSLLNASLILSLPTTSEVYDHHAENDGVLSTTTTTTTARIEEEEEEAVQFEETHAIFRQTRSHESWFRGFHAKGKVLCVGCDEHLGWFFTPTITAQQQVGSSGHEEFSTELRQDINSGALPISTAAADNNNIDDVDIVPFCGLLLKKMKQREWSLSEILRPIHASTLKRVGLAAASSSSGPRSSATDLTLADLTLRVQSLRQQTMLYIDLLTKHKEQGDVQRQLLQSQKDRIGAHEEKIMTLQQIADAQRQQLDMQQRHLKYQEDLLRNQREQIATQQQQIEVEQMLLAEQNRTIHTQLEQMKVMQAHMRAKDERLRLETEMRRLHEQRSQQKQQETQQPQQQPPTSETMIDGSNLALAEKSVIAGKLLSDQS
ncbi:Hypothetical protein, putative [Bodo saltans]|uniref:Mis18 domain-containing protein n=1 Tax=Bodo saltans TaxID=75058 RepID=A0A0S4IZT3_BODSA|nr:Hypothetical protein, putative [Bodo saltans]|eukprot:CUF94515.1 Hypothetical protein, putative [Bodo saltans]